MAIDTSGYITVTEAANRLHLSAEQVRRKLRDGKLKGYRVGNQWFVDETTMEKSARAKPLLSQEFIDSVKRLRKEANKYNEAQGNPPFDAVEMIRRHRDGA
jgi:excisionase family DNA binding protein